MKGVLVVMLTAAVAMISFGMQDVGSTPLTEDVPIGFITEGAIPADTEEVAVYNMPVDAEEWGDAFELMWNAEHEDEVIFTATPDDGELEFPTLLMAELGEALYLELHYSRTADTYWMIVSISEEYTPVRKVELYEEYFYSAIQTGLLAQYEDLTVGELKRIDAETRVIVEGLRDGELDVEDAYFFYNDTYISFENDEELGLLECYIGF